MKRHWETEELVEHWTLLPSELNLLTHKTEVNRLGFALLLKFFQYAGCFPRHKSDIPKDVLRFIAQQVNVPSVNLEHYSWQGRTIKIHRNQIRQLLQVREATLADSRALQQWLQNQVLVCGMSLENLKTTALKRLRSLRIESPTTERLNRIVNSAFRSFEQHFFRVTAQKLTTATQEKLDALLQTRNKNPRKWPSDHTKSPDGLPAPLVVLKADMGAATVETLQQEAFKLEQLRQLKLPMDLFNGIPGKVLQIYKRRVNVEAPSLLRRHPNARRYTLLTAFCQLRQQEITDRLVDLLIQTVHRLGARAEQRVERELLRDFKQVNSKTQLLYKLATAALRQPDGTIREVVYPVVAEETLRQIVQEYESTGISYRSKVYTVMRSCYSHHYRRIVPLILNLLEFRSNNDRHRPVIEAISLLKQYLGRPQRFYDASEAIPIEGVISRAWQSVIFETGRNGELRVNRIKYELAVLQALRDGLKCKEIWVVGANRDTVGESMREK
jgi:hypothetical protein